MTSSATTVEEYLAGLPEDRREAISVVRQTVLENLRPGFVEGMQYGMIGYFVPHSIFPPGYHCDPKQPLPFVHIGSQKNHMALYLMCLYQSSDLYAWFEDEYKKTGKKLDMGKACVRFKKLSDLPVELIGALIARVSMEGYVAKYEEILARVKSRPKSKR